ncbi:MAG: hypothetical protein C0593_10450, partial [Marinilabiliales bacterium]
MNKRSLFFFFLIVFFLGGMLQGQTVQKCRVVSKESGNEMPYATVLFEDGSHAVADDNGLFSFSCSDKGDSTTLSVSFVGYNDLDTCLTCSRNIHTLIMNPTAIQQKEFLVVGKKILSSDKSRSQRVIKLDSKALETLPAKDMQTLLNAIPGVTVDNTLGIYETKTTVML